MNKDLLTFIGRYYSPSEYSALAAQINSWSCTRPLDGMKILDATPVFRNTMVKYAALLAAGAELTISAGQGIPCDMEIIRVAPQFGIRVADEKILSETFDAVADCAGRHCQVKSRFGYAELTRSGLEYYRDCKQPVFSVDSGILKRFETALGTGESFVRAMRFLGYEDFKDKKVVVFGGGKVGGATAYFASQAGAKTVVVDLRKTDLPEDIRWIDASDTAAVKTVLSDAWCVVSATGLSGVLAPWANMLKCGSQLIANMGVEDEFGSALPDEMVLNHKQPLNFILDEPTALKYIDPSMALSNAALVNLINKEVAPGINMPPEYLEMEIIGHLRESGKMNEETDLILKEYYHENNVEKCCP